LLELNSLLEKFTLGNSHLKFTLAEIKFTLVEKEIVESKPILANVTIVYSLEK
jgi:hypothetical protein